MRSLSYVSPRIKRLTERATLVVAEHPAFARTFAAPDRYSFRQPWLWGLIANAEMESFSGGEFGVDFVHSDGEALVLLSGELDVATAPALREHLAELASQGLINISVDLSALRFIDSVGLSVFVVAKKHLEHMGGSFLLLRPSPRIREASSSHRLGATPAGETRRRSFDRGRGRVLGYLVLRRDVDTCGETPAS